jgi:hypothetical protein
MSLSSTSSKKCTAGCLRAEKHIGKVTGRTFDLADEHGLCMVVINALREAAHCRPQPLEIDKISREEAMRAVRYWQWCLERRMRIR